MNVAGDRTDQDPGQAPAVLLAGLSPPMIGLLIALALETAEAPAPAAPAVRGPSIPSWMEGCWEARSGERWTEECWSSPKGAMMIGYSRSGQGGTVTEWEVMQIVHAQTDDPAVPWMTFTASPSGRSRTQFNWVPANEPGLTFVNTANDYPQRIRYWREGPLLMAEISLGDGSKARRWRYSPAATRPPIPPGPSVPGR